MVRAQANAGGNAPDLDPAGKLTLMAAAFAHDDVAPAPQKTVAMAFLPGRGVIAWDVTGKTPEQAREAQIEAMGLADAQAVQREIDTAKAQEQARLQAQQAENAGAQRIAWTLPTIAGAPRQGVGGGSINPTAQSGLGLHVKNSDGLKGRPRVYAFAAVSGRSMGLNVLHDDAGWKNAGLTSDQDGHTGQQQAGLAWRKGAVQTSLSYVQEKSRMQIFGMQSDKDHRLMLTMNVQPQAVVGLFGKTP